MLRLPFLLAARNRAPVHRMAGGAGDPPAQLMAAMTRHFADMTVEDVATRKKHAGYYSCITRKLTQMGIQPSMAAIDQTMFSLMDYLEVDKTKALQTISRHPAIMSYTSENITRKMTWLLENGATEKQIHTMVLRHPNLLGLRIETMEATRKWYIDQGVAPEKIPYVFTVFPQALSTSAKNNLDQKVELLKSFGLDKKQITSILTRAPQVFSNSVEGLEKNARFLLTHCVSQVDLPKVLAITPECLSISTKNIRSTMSLLEEMFDPETARQMLSTCSRVFMRNRKELRRSYNFLVELGVPPERIARDLNIIMRNRDRILRPRAEFLEAAGMLQASMKTVRWIKDPYPNFVARFPDYEVYAQQHDGH